ncbi:MAG TPA: hypothetical protein VGJ39_11605 [Vicinamibacterales bacterium]
MAGRQRQGLDRRIGFGRLKTVPVQVQAQDSRGKADPLVAVNERMSLNQAKGVTGARKISLPPNSLQPH